MRQLKQILPKKSGRAYGKITVRHQGGRHKRFLRLVDFAHDKKDMIGVVEAIEHDPNRNAHLAKVRYADGQRRYHLATSQSQVGSQMVSGPDAAVEDGNTLPLSKIPSGTPVHNIEIRPGKGGQIVRAAGSAATVGGREEKHVLVKLPSGEVRRFHPDSMATIGQVGNAGARNRTIGKAGTNRRKGIRPTVRGLAMHPGAHPHGGGEGRSSVGMKYPKRPSGRPAVGRTRNKTKYSNSLIVTRRKKGKHS